MKKYDVIGLGNSLLDLTFEVEDTLLRDFGMKKGEMALIDKEKNKFILKSLEKHSSKMSPGGSCSNTIAGVSILGGKTAFLGKIGTDELGKIYELKTKDLGVQARFSKHKELSTGNAITFITPDKERSFAVYLGASNCLDDSVISESTISNSGILHLEGYNLEPGESRTTSLKAIDIAKNNSTKISLDLSDSSVVHRNLDFLKEVAKGVDILFVNESEALAFTGKVPEKALDHISRLCRIAVVKLGEKGSLIKSEGKTFIIPPFKAKLVNTNGAGDMYAAGLLYGISKKIGLEKSGKLASFAASLVVSSNGARLEKDLIIILDTYKSELGL